MSNDVGFDVWYDLLVDIANRRGINVADVDAWKEAYDSGQSPEEAINEDYGPE